MHTGLFNIFHQAMLFYDMCLVRIHDLYFDYYASLDSLIMVEITIFSESSL